jgi:glycosyltransferase involved in cell wall biosynthesis
VATLPQALQKTTYSAVIVTRNRPEALRLSLPLLLDQSRLPGEILVIDSSDDQSQNQALVAGLALQTSIPLRHISSLMGMTVQRNVGLKLVSHPVVFFPDDDSLVLPGAMEEIMTIYDLDRDGLIGGVCSAESKTAPVGVLEQQTAAYQMRLSDRIKARVARTRFALERAVFPDPFYACAERKYRALPKEPDWLAANNAILVPYMTGFRMSFRTELIRRRGFTEELGRYALCEDIDAGFDILRSHLLVGARKAQIYHHKAPDRRANGRAMGAMHILNRAYVLALAGEADQKMLAAMRRFSRYKILQYMVGARSGFGKDRLAGARHAYRVMPALFGAPADQLNRIYLDLRERCFSTES